MSSSSNIANKKSEASNPSFEDLSLDLQSEIVARVASTSLGDYFNLRNSCKKIRDVAEEGFVYRQVCVDKIPIDAWYSSNGRISMFINQCLENENPEALFRQAMVEYFCWGEVETAIEYLNAAAELDHHGAAAYLLGIMLLFDGEDHKDDGIWMLSTVKKSSCFNQSVLTYRKLLIDLLSTTKIRNLDVLYYRPICCDREFHGYCDACFCDFELSYIFNTIDATSTRNR